MIFKCIVFKSSVYKTEELWTFPWKQRNNKHPLTLKALSKIAVDDIINLFRENKTWHFM